MTKKIQSTSLRFGCDSDLDGWKNQGTQEPEINKVHKEMEGNLAMLEGNFDWVPGKKH